MLLEFYCRRVRAERNRRDTADPTHLATRQEIEVEISELWALPASWVRRQLNTALRVDEHFGYLRDLAAKGRVDTFRVALIAETARHALDTDEQYAALTKRLQPFFERHLRPDGGGLACTHKQMRTKLASTIRVLQSADAELRFRQAHEGRDVQSVDGENGVSC